MNDDALSALRDLASRDLSEEEIARALLDLTLQAAPPDVADAVRVCALPAWFDAGHLALLAGKEEQEAAALIEKVAAFSFVLPRERGGYVYHEATRARLLDWWREPERADRFAELNDRLAQVYLALAREQDRRLNGPDYLDAMAALDAAYPNVRAAWEGAVASEHWELVREFAYILADYFQRRGLWAEWIAWRRAGLDACERAGDAESIAGMQNNLGNAYWSLPTGDRAANLQMAIACYREALRVYTPEAAPLDYAMTQNNLGLAYAGLPTGDRAANLEQAIACYREALTIEYLPPWSRARYLRNLGDAYSEMEDYASAIATYQQAIDTTPDDPWLFNALGSVYSRQEQHEQAVEAYTAALALATADADRALLHRNRASDLVHLGRLEEAEQDCEQARTLAPDHPYTHARLGQLAFARDDYPAAVEHYTAAIERQGEPDFYFDRGLAHLALGRPGPARADYRTALSLADSITIAEARKELEEFAAGHPDTPGLDAVRALLPSSSS